MASVLVSIVLTGCGSRDDGGKAAENGTNDSAVSHSHGVASVLLFGGTGASRSDVAAIGRILERHHLKYSTVAAGPTLDQYWEDGPELSGWGAVVGKYPDGTPAIVEGSSGSGWVVLSGVHPEAPAEWRHGMTFMTSAATDEAYAWTLIEAALNRTSLPHF